VPDASCLRAWYFLWLIFSFYYSWFFLSDSAFLFVCWQRNFTVFGTNVAYSPWTYVGSGMHCLRCFLFVSWCSLGTWLLHLHFIYTPALSYTPAFLLHTCISATHLHFCYTPAFLLHLHFCYTPAFLLHMMCPALLLPAVTLYSYFCYICGLVSLCGLVAITRT